MFYLAYKRMWGWAGVVLLVSVATTMIPAGSDGDMLVTLGMLVAWIIICFKFNGWRKIWLLNHGYKHVARLQAGNLDAAKSQLYSQRGAPSDLASAA